MYIRIYNTHVYIVSSAKLWYSQYSYNCLLQEYEIFNTKVLEMYILHWTQWLHKLGASVDGGLVYQSSRAVYIP